MCSSANERKRCRPCRPHQFTKSQTKKQQTTNLKLELELGARPILTLRDTRPRPAGQGSGKSK